MKKEAWSKEEYYTYAKTMFDPAKIHEKPELLSGVRVLEFATFMNGPLVTGFLAEIGAEVIKFELPPGTREDLPPGGDTARYQGLPGTDVKGSNLITFTTCRNKYHVTLDIAHPKGAEIFRQLAIRPDTDVIVENLRAGAMDRLGIGYRHLSKDNPRLIYLATNGPGQWGSGANMISLDAVAQALGGFVYVTGFPENDPHNPGIPTLSATAIGDSAGALWGFAGVLAALFYRERTGEGQFIEFSQIEGLMRLYDLPMIRYSINGTIQERLGNRFDYAAPYYISRCKDGYVFLGAIGNKLFSNLCRAMGNPDLAKDSRFSTNADRARNQLELYEIIDHWLLQYTKKDLRKIADEYSFVCGPVFNAKDICEFPHFQERGSIIEVDDPYYGRMKVATLPIHFSETPARIRTLAKPVGADNEYIYGKYLGLSKGDLEGLRAEKVI